MARSKENLGVTVNGVPLNYGEGLWDPDFFSATSRDARYAERHRPTRKRPTRGSVVEDKMKRGTTITRTGRTKALPIEEVRRRAMFGY